MDFITQTKEVPVVGSYDVVVCGGGPAGLIAAIAAARGGARTALVERYGFLGGMATAGLVAPISVFNYNGRRIVGGIPWEFVERLAGIGGAEEEKPLGNITFSPEKYKLVAQRMLLEAGVTLYFHSYLTGCRTEEGRISHVVIENKNGAEALVARYFIDATGDADLALRAGVPMQPAGTTLQPASLIFMLGGVDTDALPMLRHSRQGVNYHDLAIREALEALREREEVPLFGGPWYCGVLTPGVVLVNMTRTQADMADNREATAAECLLHEHVHLFTELLAVTCRPSATPRCSLPPRRPACARRAASGVSTRSRARSISMPSTFPTLFRGDVIRSTSTPPRRPDSGASSSKRRPSFPTAA